MLNLVVCKETARLQHIVSRPPCWILVFIGCVLVDCCWGWVGIYVLNLHGKCLQHVGTHLLDCTASQNDVISYCHCLLLIHLDHSPTWSVDWLPGANLEVTALFVIFPAFHENRNFIIEYRKARHLFWARIIQSRQSNPMCLIINITVGRSRWSVI